MDVHECEKIYIGTLIRYVYNRPNGRSKSKSLKKRSCHQWWCLTSWHAAGPLPGSYSGNMNTAHSTRSGLLWHWCIVPTPGSLFPTVIPARGWTAFPVTCEMNTFHHGTIHQSWVTWDHLICICAWSFYWLKGFASRSRFPHSWYSGGSRGIRWNLGQHVLRHRTPSLQRIHICSRLYVNFIFRARPLINGKGLRCWVSLHIHPLN